jgi:hypothetical protein
MFHESRAKGQLVPVPLGSDDQPRPVELQHVDPVSVRENAST